MDQSVLHRCPYRVGDFLNRGGKPAFKVLGILGAGGMGYVLRVRNVRLGSDAVMKVLKPELAVRPEALERFEYEARAQHLLSQENENVVRVSDLENLDDSTPYFLMEYLRGRTLGAELRERPTLPIEEAIDIAAQICVGLYKIHSRGVIHRDIKSENIFLTRDSDGDLVVKIIDFGILVVLANEPDPEPHCTPPFAAPEQLLRAPLGPWTDIYAVGGLLYQLLAGERPYAAYGSRWDQAFSRVNVEAPKLSKHGDFPPALVDLIASALALDPKARPVDAHAFGKKLEQIKLQLPPVDPHEIVTAKQPGGANSQVDGPITFVTLASSTEPGGVWFEDNHSHGEPIGPGDGIESKPPIGGQGLPVATSFPYMPHTLPLADPVPAAQIAAMRAAVTNPRPAENHFPAPRQRPRDRESVLVTPTVLFDPQSAEPEANRRAAPRALDPEARRRAAAHALAEEAARDRALARQVDREIERELEIARVGRDPQPKPEREEKHEEAIHRGFRPNAGQPVATRPSPGQASRVRNSRPADAPAEPAPRAARASAPPRAEQVLRPTRMVPPTRVERPSRLKLWRWRWEATTLPWRMVVVVLALGLAAAVLAGGSFAYGHFVHAPARSAEPRR